MDIDRDSDEKESVQIKYFLKKGVDTNYLMEPYVRGDSKQNKGFSCMSIASKKYLDEYCKNYWGDSEINKISYFSAATLGNLIKGKHVSVATAKGIFLMWCKGEKDYKYDFFDIFEERELTPLPLPFVGIYLQIKRTKEDRPFSFVFVTTIDNEYRINGVSCGHSNSQYASVATWPADDRSDKFIETYNAKDTDKIKTVIQYCGVKIPQKSDIDEGTVTTVYKIEEYGENKRIMSGTGRYTSTDLLTTVPKTVEFDFFRIDNTYMMHLLNGNKPPKQAVVSEVQTIADILTARKEYCLVVFTGGPGTYKSTVLKMFKKLGFPVIGEAAIEVLEDYDKESHGGLEEYRQNNNTELQERIAIRHAGNEFSRLKNLQDEQYKGRKIIFIDRTMIDCVAYLKYKDVRPSEDLSMACNHLRYDEIFLFKTPHKDEFIEDRGKHRTSDYDRSLKMTGLLDQTYEYYSYRKEGKITEVTGDSNDRFKQICDHLKIEQDI